MKTLLNFIYFTPLSPSISEMQERIKERNDIVNSGHMLPWVVGGAVEGERVGVRYSWGVRERFVHYA